MQEKDTKYNKIEEGLTREAYESARGQVFDAVYKVGEHVKDAAKSVGEALTPSNAAPSKYNQYTDHEHTDFGPRNTDAASMDH